MISPERPYPAIDIIDFFKTRSALVVAAVAALDSLPAALETLKLQIDQRDVTVVTAQLRVVGALVGSAAIGPDNLLVADPASAHEPFVMCSVSRQPSGAVDLKTIELDRDTLALTGATAGTTPRPLDALTQAIEALTPGSGAPEIDAVSASVAAISLQVRAIVSRLSILKARIDLQQSFLSSVMEADLGAPLVRLDSHLNQAGVRDMALEARRLLSGRSLNIASGNRKTLASLFESHAAKES